MDGIITYDEAAGQASLASDDMDDLLLRLITAEATVDRVRHLHSLSGPTLFRVSLRHALDGQP